MANEKKIKNNANLGLVRYVAHRSALDVLLVGLAETN